jgi:hypothetical protein
MVQQQGSGQSDGQELLPAGFDSDRPFTPPPIGMDEVQKERSHDVNLPHGGELGWFRACRRCRCVVDEGFVVAEFD